MHQGICTYRLRGGAILMSSIRLSDTGHKAGYKMGAQCMCRLPAVTDTVFFCRRQLCSGTVALRQVEQRVVAEAAITFISACNPAFPCSLTDDGHRVPNVAQIDDDALIASTAVR